MGGERFTTHRDRVRSKSGGWTVGGQVTLHGYNIHQELVPNTTWMQTVLLAITGRMFPKIQIRLIEAMMVGTGYPDPRLWCNRVSALAGTTRVPAAASLAAGIASGEARLFGRQVDYQAALIIQTARRILDEDEEGELALEAYIEALLKRRRCVYGFGRPLTKVEERIAPIEVMAKRLGIEDGPHLKTARRIEKFMKRRRQIMNFAAYSMARLLDFDLSPVEAYRIAIITFYTGLLPCYIEAFDNEPGTFLPIACEDILYEGVGERPLP